MKIHRDCPSNDVLAAYAFRRFPDMQTLRLSIPSPRSDRPDLATFEMHSCPIQHDPQRRTSYTYSPAYLWELMKLDQAIYQQAHPESLVEEYG